MAKQKTPLNLASASLPGTDFPCVLVRSNGGAGYWGRGKTVEEAIKASTWINAGDAVFIVAVDEAARCSDIDGSIRFNRRGPIWAGKVTRNRKDVAITGKDRD